MLTQPPDLAPAPAKRHLLTIAVEDYFQVVAFRKLIDTSVWYRFERRVERNTRRALDLLDEFGVKATFFTLGWVAEEMPEIVCEIVARGHEVASKGYYHRTFQDMTPGEFREDLQHSREAIERATGIRVKGYRVARGHLGLADLGLHHGLLELPGQHALERERGRFLQSTFLAQKVLEIAADVWMCLLACHV